MLTLIWNVQAEWVKYVTSVTKNKEEVCMILL